MRIGIVGARLSGSYAAFLLARMGHDVLLFEPAAWCDKPCGGGVTAKAWSSISWLRRCTVPHTVVRQMRFWSQAAERSVLHLKQPIRIFARSELDRALLDDALRAGARLVPERAVQFTRAQSGWRVRTTGGGCEVDFLVGADGAKSAVRSVLAGGFRSADLSLALGYYIPGTFHPDSLVVVFQERGFKGYLWSFPRVDHLSVGIVCWLPEAAAADMKARVERFIARCYPGASDQRRLYAARIPCLSRDRLRRQQVAAADWALIGDAAGFADPVTGEGIYYAFRSAELLGSAIERGDPLAYERLWRREFGPDLERAAAWRDRFYGGALLSRSLTGLAAALAGRSSAAAALIERAVSSPRGCRRLPGSLLIRSPLMLWEGLRGRRGPPVS